MNVPLIASVNNSGEFTCLDIWSNGRKQTVSAPFRPYIFSKSNLGQIKDTKSWPETKRSLSTLTEEEYFRYELKKTSQVYQIKDQYEQYLPPLNFAEASMPFVHRVLIDEPEFYSQYANTGELRVLHIDVEQWFDEFFPTADDPIIALGLGFGNSERIVLLAKDTSKEEEKRILKEFARKLEEFDPDLIVGYNHKRYDIPRIYHRMVLHGLNPHIWGREGPTVINAEEDDVEIEGRILYDVWHSVEQDQTLHGIKNRKMKTVAKWFNLEGVVDFPEESFKDLVGTEKLREYNESDINITQQLFDIYFPKIRGMAEYLGSPLSELIPFADAFPATIQQARILGKKGIVSDGLNKERYPKIFEKEEGEEDRKFFEGANVELYKRGYFEKCFKYDFGSMYPHIMWSIGIGPDNTKLIDVVPYGKFSCYQEGDVRVYSVPDSIHNVNFIIRVEGESDVAKFIQDMLETRLKLKKKAKEISKTGSKKEAEAIESQQYALKVVLNSVYGQNGAGFLRYGSAPVAILVVGIARQLIDFLKDMCKDGAVEIDTDGLYTDKPYSLDNIINQINFFTSVYLLGKPVMKVEDEEYLAAWFHKAKNYLLLKMKDGEYIIVKHGGAFKGSKLPGLFDRIIDDVGMELLRFGPQVAIKEARKKLDLSQYDPSEFVQQVKLTMDPGEYKSENALSLQVANDAQLKTGQKPIKGTMYRYVKTQTGYEYYNMEAFSRLDVEYYKGVIFDALDRLGFEKDKLLNKSIFEYGGQK